MSEHLVDYLNQKLGFEDLNGPRILNIKPLGNTGNGTTEFSVMIEYHTPINTHIDKTELFDALKSLNKDLNTRSEGFTKGHKEGESRIFLTQGSNCQSRYDALCSAAEAALTSKKESGATPIVEEKKSSGPGRRT